MPVSKQNAVISVYHKDGIDIFVQALVDLGWTIYSSGGTANFLREHGITVIDTAEFIGSSVAEQVKRIAAGHDHTLPSMVLGQIKSEFGGSYFGHRVVTLDQHIHGGMLCREKQETDIADLESSVVSSLTWYVSTSTPWKRRSRAMAQHASRSLN
ncbi:MAG: hypothetical protein PHY34_05060 [Patescibacteria group bacterium]|nr:hypothetical protein [Patescibacteria group bacterium]MDD5715521.1 hypothetical protein [Patescibacteria group bacterium]